MVLPRFLTSDRFLTGLQIGGGVLGGVATISFTKTILDDMKYIAPFVLGSAAILGTVYLVA